MCCLCFDVLADIKFDYTVGFSVYSVRQIGFWSSDVTAVVVVWGTCAVERCNTAM